MKRVILALLAIGGLALTQLASAQSNGGTGNKGSLANMPTADFAVAPSQMMAAAPVKMTTKPKRKARQAQKPKHGQTSGSGAPARP